MAQRIQFVAPLSDCTFGHVQLINLWKYEDNLDLLYRQEVYVSTELD